MKYKDILKIAMLRLKNKNSKRTIFIMVFGLVMLIPVLWLIFSFYFNFYDNIHDNQSVDMMFRIDSDFGQSIDIRGGEKSTKFYEENRGIQLTFEQYEDIKTDDTVEWFSFVLNYYRESGNSNIHIGDKILGAKDNIECKFVLGEKIIPDSIQNYIYSTTGHNAVYGQGFSENKREILVSEKWLKENGLSKEDVLNKEISLDINYVGFDFYNNFDVILDNDTIFENQHISAYDKNYKPADFVGNISVFKNYKIVGVVSEEYFSINDFTAIDSDFWFKDTAIIDDSGQSVYPKLSLQDVYKDGKLTSVIVATYPSTDWTTYSQEVTEQGCFFPFLQGNIHTRTRSMNRIYPIKSAFVQYDNFKEAKANFKKLENILGDYIFASQYGAITLNFYRLVSEEKNISIACGIMGVVGGITLITVIANYGAAVCFNARKRKDFLQMMYRMGITQKEKKMIVWTEIMSIFMIASAIAFIISLFIAIIIKLVVDSIIKQFIADTVFKISLIYIIPAFLVLFLLVGVIVVLISLMSNKIIKEDNK